MQQFLKCQQVNLLMTLLYRVGRKTAPCFVQ